MAAKYYIRPRKVDDPKKWLGPFDASQLRDQAERRLFSKELHEYSEDRLNWISARQIWPTLFPKNAKPINVATQPGIVFTPTAVANEVTDASATNSTTEQAVPVQEAGEWYCACDGVQHGPFTFSQLRELVTRGQLQPTDLIWRPSLGEQWIEAQSDPNLFPAANASDLQINSTSGSGNPSGNAPPLAVASFVLGLLGTSLLLGIGSILAIIFGHVCLERMRHPNTPQTGKWMAITGLSLGYSILAILMTAGIVYLAIN